MQNGLGTYVVRAISSSVPKLIAYVRYRRVL